VSFDELRNCLRVSKHGDGLLERFEVLGTYEHSCRGPVAGYHDPFVVLLDSVDELGEPVAD